MRVIAEFEKAGSAAWISHLDLQRTVSRALRRARVPAEYSRGFNPHMRLSFASALSVGCESGCEVMDVMLEGEISANDFTGSMNGALPRGLRVMRTCVVHDASPAPMALVTAARYEALLPGGCEVVEAFLGKEEIIVPKKSKKGMRDTDIAPMILEFNARGEHETLLDIKVRHDSAASLNPVLLFDAMGMRAKSIRRTELFSGKTGLFDFYAQGGEA